MNLEIFKKLCESFEIETGHKPKVAVVDQTSFFLLQKEAKKRLAGLVAMNEITGSSAYECFGVKIFQGQGMFASVQFGF